MVKFYYYYTHICIIMHCLKPHTYVFEIFNFTIWIGTYVSKTININLYLNYGYLATSKPQQTYTIFGIQYEHSVIAPCKSITFYVTKNSIIGITQRLTET